MLWGGACTLIYVEDLKLMSIITYSTIVNIAEWLNFSLWNFQLAKIYLEIIFDVNVNLLSPTLSPPSENSYNNLLLKHIMYIIFQTATVMSAHALWHISTDYELYRYLCNRSEQLVHALETSTFYCCKISSLGFAEKLINRLQRLQNTSARVVTYCSKVDYTS